MNKKIVKFLGLAAGAFVSYKFYSKLSKNKTNNSIKFNQPDEEQLNKSPKGDPVSILNTNKKDSNTWKHSYLNANGIKFHYVTEGEGPLLVLLHGFPENWYSWKEQIPFLAEKYQVVAIDMRGYNLTDKPDHVKDYKLSVLADDIKGVIDNFGVEKATVIGHDWGGTVAWVFAMTYPELVEKLVIMNAPHPVGFIKALKSSLQIFNSLYMLFFQLPVIPEKLFEKDNYRFMGERMKKYSANPEKSFAEDHMKHYLDSLRQPKAITSMLNYYRALVRFGVGDNIKKINTPTMIIWGEKDKFLRKNVNNGLEEYVTDLTIKCIPEASHWVNRDEPEKVNHLLAEFLF